MFPKNLHVAQSDSGLAHAAAKAMHHQSDLVEQRRSARRLPSNMSPLNKAKARAGRDLILACEDRKGMTMIAFFGAAARRDEVGFALGVEMTMRVSRSHSHTRRAAVAAISNHCAARVLGRTVHRPDHDLLREAVRPALELVATLWVKDAGQALTDSLADATARDSGDNADGAVAVVTSRGALLGRVWHAVGGLPQWQFATWVDAGTAADHDLRAHARDCERDNLLAVLLVKRDGQWVNALKIER